MKTFSISAALAALALTATPALADGERAFRTCAACHSIEDADGNRIAGRGAKTGPNLYGVVGRVAGSVEGFRYRDGLPAAGEAGLVWDAETLAAYSPDPQGFLREYTGDNSLRSAMAGQRVRKMDDLIAFLTEHSPDAPSE